MTGKDPFVNWMCGIALVVTVLFTSKLALAAVGPASDFKVYANNVVVDIPKASSSIVLTTGQSVYVYAKGTATSSTIGNIMQALKVVCNNTYIWSTRNHEGKDAYISDGGKLVVPIRFLFTAPSTGTYTCKLQALAASGDGALPSDYLLFKGGAANTSISLSSPLAGADKWGTEDDFTDYDYAGGKYDDTAIHIGPELPAGSAEYALRSSRWQASDNASSIDVIGDVELTVCYQGTGSCPAYAWGDSAIHDTGSSVDTRLIIQQMPDATANTPCAITYDPPTGYYRTTLTTSAHHQKIFHRSSNVPFSAACGASRYFISKVEVRWISNNPVRIEPGSASAGYSIGIAQNR